MKPGEIICMIIILAVACYFTWPYQPHVLKKRIDSLESVVLYLNSHQSCLCKTKMEPSK